MLSSLLRAALNVIVFAALLSACTKDVLEGDPEPVGHGDEVPDAGSPTDDSDEERDAAVLPVQPAQPSIVQHCVGTRRTCASASGPTAA